MAAAKYLQFVTVFVGVASGTRIRLLEGHIDAPSRNRAQLASQLTQHVWALSIYHTLVALLQSIVWLLVVFACLAFAALCYLRRSHIKSLLAESEDPIGTREQERIVTIR